MPRPENPRPGRWCWVGIILWVAGWDLNMKNQTASDYFWNAKWLWPLWLYITGHLFHVIPQEYDPLRREWARRDQ